MQPSIFDRKKTPGKIRVGVQGTSYPNYKNIIVMTPSNAKKWYPLSPYALKDENRYIMENLWQFGKVYNQIPKSTQRYSRWDNTVIWDHPEEVHIENGTINEQYRAWREKGFKNPYAVRYPVGKEHARQCLYYLDESGDMYDWIEARKKVYFSLYSKMCQETKEFRELRKMLDQGINLLIIEPDGPRQRSLNHYIQTYQVDSNFIESGTIEINQKNMDIMINDRKHSFGHGYCLAMTLLGLGVD